MKTREGEMKEGKGEGIIRGEERKRAKEGECVEGDIVYWMCRESVGRVKVVT